MPKLRLVEPGAVRLVIVLNLARPGQQALTMTVWLQQVSAHQEGVKPNLQGHTLWCLYLAANGALDEGDCTGARATQVPFSPASCWQPWLLALHPRVTRDWSYCVRMRRTDPERQGIQLQSRRKVTQGRIHAAATLTKPCKNPANKRNRISGAGIAHASQI